jgi:hypothetical protein
MTFEDQIKNEYFDWLYDYVCKGRAHDNMSYKKIFALLHDTEFIFHIAKDFNRAKDGVDLRYKFAIKHEDIWDSREVMYILDGPCTVLEMMVALAARCEESIMDDTRYGDRTGQWFWSMMYNLGIDYMYDELYDENAAIEIIDIFLDRRYEPDGRGGLFHIRGCREDLRDIEIWTQLNWYLEGYA